MRKKRMRKNGHLKVIKIKNQSHQRPKTSHQRPKTGHQRLKTSHQRLNTKTMKYLLGNEDLKRILLFV